MQPVEEKLASFYLGQAFDLAQGKAVDQKINYDARDLTTHAVIVGMTGSGKTGLGIIVLEEAALDGVPALVIDPKGDMTNLLLTFPDLRPEDLMPWVNPDDARRKNMELPAFAAAQADSWRQGLASSGESPDRIRRLKEAADFAIYTPGSAAGRQVSILDSFSVPPLDWATDAELLRDKISSTVSALLALVGIEADPVRSREHILLTNVFENAWRAGQSLDLAQLILRIQKPPFSQLGVFPVDTFYPEKDRMELAMMLNGLIASPSFADWMQGDPLDVDALLRSPSGKPRVTIFYIAHLSDVERQFFVTLLLEQVVSWVRAQSGTTSLRALLYMDEVFGYLPPLSNPPTKVPMLTLLKQARAFGLGLVLATQNPVDLDYKALSNAGTWFIGRMQADRDKQRLLDGLEGVQSGTGGPSRSDLDKMISGIQPRVFLLHNVKEDRPTVFTTRWALSYLRGPLTPTQVRQLEGPALAAPAPAPASAARPAQPAAAAASKEPPLSPPRKQGGGVAPYQKVPPQLPSTVRQVFLPVEIPFEAALSDWARRSGMGSAPAGIDGTLVYCPGLAGLGRLYFAHAASRQTFTEEVSYLSTVEESRVDWSKGAVQLATTDLGNSPRSDGVFADLPGELGTDKEVATLEKQFQEYLFYNSTWKLLYNPNVKLYSKPDETPQQFQRRCRQAAEAARDAEIKPLKAKYETRLNALEGRIEREERELEQDKAEYGARKQDEVLSGAEAVFSLFSGRRSSSRISKASSKRRMTSKAKADVKESQEAIDEMEKQLGELEREAKDEVDQVTAKWQKLMDEVQEIEVRPKRSDVQVSLFAVAWVPTWEVSVAGQTVSMAAFRTRGT